MLKRVLPFTLTLIIGIALSYLINFIDTPAPKTTQMSLEQRTSHSRTWLIIHSLGEMSCPKANAYYIGRGPVEVRALLGADGKVWQVYPAENYPDSLTANALKAAKQIQFTPATKDGVPVSVWLNVTYRCYASQFGCSIDYARTGVTEAGEEWRVIHE